MTARPVSCFQVPLPWRRNGLQEAGPSPCHLVPTGLSLSLAFRLPPLPVVYAPHPAQSTVGVGIVTRDLGWSIAKLLFKSSFGHAASLKDKSSSSNSTHSSPMSLSSPHILPSIPSPVQSCGPAALAWKVGSGGEWQHLSPGVSGEFNEHSRESINYKCEG